MYEKVKVNTLQGYEHVLDIYEVDKYGNVYGKDGITLKEKDNGHGYKLARLKVQNKRKWKTAYKHRLVALAYIPNPENLPEVNHKDEDKTNNAVNNLEWCTREYNCNYGTHNERMSLANGNKCFVYDYKLNYIGEFYSVKSASEHVGVDLKPNTKVKQYFCLPTNDVSVIPKIVRKTKAVSVVITNIYTHEKQYFYSNREARRFFDNKVNITQAIQKNLTVRGKYKARILNYKKLIDSLDL